MENEIVRSVDRRRYELSTLLKAISAENIHEPIESGEPMGREGQE